MQVLIRSFHISYNVLDYIHDNNFQKMQTHTYILLEVFIHSHRPIYKFTMDSNAYICIQGQQNT